MDDQDEERVGGGRRRSVFEKHLQTALSTLVVALIWWGYTKLDEVRYQTVEAVVQIRALRESVVELKTLRAELDSRLSNQFTSKQGEALISEVTRMNQRIADHEKRIDRIEQRLQSPEYK